MKSSGSTRFWVFGAALIGVASTGWLACSRTQPAPAAPPPPAVVTPEKPVLLPENDPNTIFGARDTEAVPVLRLPELPFEERSQGLPSSGTWRGYPLLHDFNMDGRADLVASNREEDGYNTWEAPKAGPWIRHIEGLPRDMAYGPARAADMNGDGIDDLVLSAHTDAVRVYFNDGQMNWTRSPGTIEIKNLLLDVAVGNLNGDSFTDVVGIAHFQGGIQAYVGDGKGGLTLLPETRTIISTETFGQMIQLTDMDGDGLDDIVTSSNSGLKVFLTKKGDPLHWEDASAGLPNPKIGNSITAVRVGRFVAGGWPQLAVGLLADPSDVGEARNGIGVYAWNQTTKEWAHIDKGLPREHTYRDVLIGDLDRDGNQDLLTMSPDSGGAIYLGDGQGGFKAKGRLAGVHGKCRGVLGDVDGDGSLDVVVSTGGSKGSPESGGLRAFLNRPAVWK